MITYKCKLKITLELDFPYFEIVLKYKKEGYLFYDNSITLSCVNPRSNSVFEENDFFTNVNSELDLILSCSEEEFMENIKEKIAQREGIEKEATDRVEAVKNKIKQLDKFKKSFKINI